MVDLEELYRLTQENNAMLKEIVEYAHEIGEYPLGFSDELLTY